MLSLMAPFTPFITEELYHTYFSQEGSVHTSGWPEPPKEYSVGLNFGSTIISVLHAVRKKKSEAKASMKAPVKKLIIQVREDISNALPDLKATINAESIELGPAEEQITPNVKITVEL